MNYISVGDLSLSYLNQRHNTRIKNEIARLSEELASGRKSDLSTVGGGDFAPIVDLNRSLRANAAYGTAIAEADLMASTMQDTLSSISSHSQALGPALLNAGNSASPTMIQAATSDARVRFEAVLSGLNTQVAGRYLFSGKATDTPPMADAGTIIADLKLAVAGASTAADVEAAVDAWFDTPGGGYETVAYQGSTSPLERMQLSDSDTVALGLTAADGRVRQVLKGFALAALVSDGVLAGNTQERAALTLKAGERLLGGDSSLALLRADVGTAQARIEAASARNASERSALEITRSKLTSADPYKTATELESARTQLESIYRLTARLSRLSLSEFL